jgi:hypothetical protein
MTHWSTFMKSRTTLAVIAVATLALLALLLLAGCGPKHAATIAAQPTTSAEHAGVQKGQALLESCIPNGHTVVTTVLNKTASGLTYYQLARFFIKEHGLSRVWTCVATKPGPVPAPQAKAALEKCGASKVVPIWKGDHHWIRDRKAVAPQILNAAAICAGKYA